MFVPFTAFTDADLTAVLREMDAEGTLCSPEFNRAIARENRGRVYTVLAWLWVCGVAVASYSLYTYGTATHYAIMGVVRTEQQAMLDGSFDCANPLRAHLPPFSIAEFDIPPYDPIDDPDTEFDNIVTNVLAGGGAYSEAMDWLAIYESELAEYEKTTQTMRFAMREVPRNLNGWIGLSDPEEPGRAYLLSLALTARALVHYDDGLYLEARNSLTAARAIAVDLGAGRTTATVEFSATARQHTYDVISVILSGAELRGDMDQFVAWVMDDPPIGSLRCAMAADRARIGQLLTDAVVMIGDVPMLSMHVLDRRSGGYYRKIGMLNDDGTCTTYSEKMGDSYEPPCVANVPAHDAMGTLDLYFSTMVRWEDLTGADLATLIVPFIHNEIAQHPSWPHIMARRSGWPQAIGMRAQIIAKRQAIINGVRQSELVSRN